MKVKLFYNGEIIEVRSGVPRWKRGRYLEGVASWYVGSLPGPWDLGLYTEAGQCTHFVANDGEETGPAIKVRRLSF